MSFRARGPERLRESLHAVFDNRSRRGRMCRGKERQREHIGVPEDVPAVPVAGQPARADRGITMVGDRRHQSGTAQP